MNEGDLGKLGEVGKIDEVNLDRVDDGLKDSGGMSHSDMPGSFLLEVILCMIAAEEFRGRSS